MVGLGNPGDKYEGTRHNVGAEAVEVLVEEFNGSLSPTKQAALAAELRIGELRVVAAFPQTFMNHSGRSVREVMHRHGIEQPEAVLVLSLIHI